LSNKNPNKNRLKSVAPEGWRVHALEVATTVTLAKSPVRTENIVMTTNESMVICDTEIPNHDGDRKGFEVMTSSQQTGPFGSVVSLLTTSPNQGNHHRNKLVNIVLTLRYILLVYRCCWNVATYKWKVYNIQNLNHIFCHTASFFNDPHCHCQFSGVGLYMNQN
jgi:hypothetical protein